MGSVKTISVNTGAIVTEEIKNVCGRLETMH